MPVHQGTAANLIQQKRIDMPLLGIKVSHCWSKARDYLGNYY